MSFISGVRPDLCSSDGFFHTNDTFYDRLRKTHAGFGVRDRLNALVGALQNGLLGRVELECQSFFRYKSNYQSFEGLDGAVEAIRKNSMSLCWKLRALLEAIDQDLSEMDRHNLK